MDMNGERRLPATRAQVWRALNDPETLRTCIPGCRTLEPVGTNSYRAVAAVTIGPVTANFTGNLALLDLEEPVSYRLEGSSQGGEAGFAKGGATVSLEEDGAATVLRYAVSAELGGKIAELDTQVIGASARQMADAFLDNLTASVASPAPVAADGPAAAVAAIAAPARLPFPVPPRVLGFPLMAWAAAAVFAFIVYNLFVS